MARRIRHGLVGLPAPQLRVQEQGGEQIAGTVRGVCQLRSRREPGALAAHAQHTDAAVTAGNGSRRHQWSRQSLCGKKGLFHAADGHARKARKLEGIGRYDIRQGQQRAGHRFGHAGPGIGATVVPEYRIEAVDCARILPHAPDRLGDWRGLIRMSEIARNRSVAPGKPAIRGHCVQESADGARSSDFALYAGVARMAGQEDGGDSPNLVPKPLECKPRGTVTHMAKDDLGLE